MRFLIDRCAGRRLAEWLVAEGHDVSEARWRRPDPGDATLLEWAAAENRILVTIDTDFGALIHLHGAPHAGLIRLPDVPAATRIALLRQILQDHSEQDFGRSGHNGAGQQDPAFPLAARLRMISEGRAERAGRHRAGEHHTS